jgi:hypothetical protein
MNTQPLLINPNVPPAEITAFASDVSELQAQAERAVINNQESFDTATDFLKICTAKARRIEDIRKTLVKPLNDHVKFINSLFAPIGDGVEQAKAIVERKAREWKIAEDKRIREAEMARRKAEEEAAMKAAEAAQQAGNQQLADAIIDVAVSSQEKSETKAPAGRGTLTGATGSLRTRWVGRVDGVRAMCAAIASGDLPESIIRISQSDLNACAEDQLGKFVDRFYKASGAPVDPDSLDEFTTPCGVSFIKEQRMVAK